MRTIRKVLFTSLIMFLLLSCGGRDAATTVAVSHVDSAAQSAPDTLRASTDTSSRKKEVGPDRAPDSAKH